MKKCIIIGAGEFFGEPAKILREKGDVLVIAADGGYGHCLRHGIKPDAVIGDFDSSGEKPSDCVLVCLPPEKDDTDTLVFDEIDTGISGKPAWKVAEKLGRLSRNLQFICITHLSQIASMADSHFLIEKNIKNDRTVTDIRELTGEESLKEMARLLGSGELTEAVLCNAREMRQTAEKVKESR